MTSRDRKDSLTSEEIAKIVKFLATAPHDVAPWAKEQSASLERLRARLEEDDDECFYEDFEDEDDVLSAYKPKEKLEGSEPEKMPKGFKLVLAVVLIVGVVTGIWWAGKPSEPAGEIPMTMADQTETEAPQAARLIELEEAVEEDPTNVNVRLELGTIYFDTGWVEGAREQWEAALEQDPENVMALYNLGFAYLSEEPPNVERAEQMWQEMLTLDPESELAQTALMHLEQMLDNIDGDG